MQPHNFKDGEKHKLIIWWAAVGALSAAAVFLAMTAISKRGTESGGAFSVEVVVSSGTIRQGGSLDKRLEEEGVPGADIKGAVRAMQSVFDLRRSQPSHRYEVVSTTSGAFLNLTYRVDALRSYYVEKSSAGVFSARKEEAPLEEIKVGAVGTIKSSLWEAMQSQGVGPETIYKFVELFAWQVDFLTEPRVGDTFRLIWKQGKNTERGVTAEREIIGAMYDGKETGKVFAVRFQNDYYDLDGKSMRRAFLRAPLNFRRISSTFSRARYHPILRTFRPHLGIDYAAASGTPIVSVGDGVVVFKGWKGGFGNTLKIRHSNSSYASSYGHLLGFAKGISVGKHVSQGQVVGYVGSTGLSTGPHLDFRFEQGGSFVNFLRIRMPSQKNLTSKQDLTEFARIREFVTKKLEALPKDGKGIFPVR